MSGPLVSLQLWLPAPLQDELTDALLAWPGRIDVFQVFEASAFGPAVALRLAREQVRGSAAWVGAQVQIEADQLEPLLAHLGAQTGLAGLRWSATPLISAGSLS